MKQQSLVRRKPQRTSRRERGGSSRTTETGTCSRRKRGKIHDACNFCRPLRVKARGWVAVKQTVGSCFGASSTDGDVRQKGWSASCYHGATRYRRPLRTVDGNNRRRGRYATSRTP